MSVIATINPEHISPAVLTAFSVRHAARAVVQDITTGRIALVHVGAHDYHKLPGGGIEEGEDIATALARECREELGCAIYIGESLGEVHEYRAQFQQHQISYCFVAQVQGAAQQPAFTEAEMSAGFAVVWYTAQEALMILQSETPADYVGQFIVARDSAIITAAERHL